jgi:hypothetical protein
MSLDGQPAREFRMAGFGERIRSGRLRLYVHGPLTRDHIRTPATWLGSGHPAVFLACRQGRLSAAISHGGVNKTRVGAGVFLGFAEIRRAGANFPALTIPLP